MQVINLVVLALTLLLEIWLLLLLIKRRTHRYFPVFFTYIMSAAPITLARLLASFGRSAYFYMYWCTEPILLALSLAALHGVFRWVFEGLFHLWWFRLFYYGTMVIVLAIAARNAFVSPPAQGLPVVSLILVVGTAVNFVRMGIIALFAVFDRILEMEFERHAHGIVIGFGISSIGSLIGFIAVSGFGSKLISFARIAPAVAYILALAVWVAAFIRPEPEDTEWTPPMPPEQMLEEVKGYLRVLDILKQFLRKRR